MIMDQDHKTVLNDIKSNEYATITDIVRRLEFSRSKVRTILAKLEGANKIKFRSVGMAKVYEVK